MGWDTWFASSFFSVRLERDCNLRCSWIFIAEMPLRPCLRIVFALPSHPPPPPHHHLCRASPIRYFLLRHIFCNNAFAVRIIPIVIAVVYAVILSLLLLATCWRVQTAENENKRISSRQGFFLKAGLDGWQSDKQIGLQNSFITLNCTASRYYYYYY